MTTPAAPAPPAAAEPAPAPLRRRLAAPAASAALVSAAVGYVAVVDPDQPGHYPVCPFLRLTGWWCPGCGGLRCVHALTRGEVLTAARDNVLVLGVVAAALLLWLRWTAAALRGQRAVLPRLRTWQVTALVAVPVVFEVARNTPFGGFLAP